MIGAIYTAAQSGERQGMSAQTYNAAVDMVDRNVAEGRAAKIAFSDPARRLTYGGLTDRRMVAMY
jgi:hypothetical protein